MSARNEELVNYLKSRRSVPAKVLVAPGPAPEEVAEIISIASRVPDHGKLAPWRFVLFAQPAAERLGQRILARALELNPGLDDTARELEANRLLRSPCCIMLVSRAGDHPKIPVWEQELSAGAAAMKLLIAANAIGYEAQWISEWIAFDEQLRDDFGLAEGERIAGFFHVGMPSMPKTERDRPSLDAIFSTMEA